MSPANDETLISDDMQIVQRVQQGDKNAYNVLVIKYQNRVLQVALKFVHNHADANDIAQEAFIKAYRAIASFKGQSSFYTWLYRIVINTAKTFLENNAKYKNNIDVDELNLSEEESLMNNSSSPDAQIHINQMQACINQAISELSEELRHALVLREVEGFSYEDIASIMKTPIGTVRSRIFRARQFIEEQMNKNKLME